MFKPSADNIGGRKQITELVFNHHKTLLNTKPTINIHERPRSHVDSNRSPGLKTEKMKLKENEEFQEVFEAFKRIKLVEKGNAKKGTDNTKPNTIGLKQMISDGRSKKQKKIEDFEHLLKLKSQERRIADIGKMKERKKNEFDPVANPPVIFKKVQKKTSADGMDYIFSSTVNNKKVPSTVPVKLRANTTLSKK